MAFASFVLESAEIIVMLNSAFDDCGGDKSVNLAPEGKVKAMEAVNAIVYPGINDGVYR